MSEAPPLPPAPAPVPGRVKGRKRRALGRWTKRLILLTLAVICGLFVTFFTVDIGDWFGMRQQAEKFGTGYMNGRQLHIGKVRAHMWPGRFAIDDVRIDGRSPGDRSFLFAKEITCHLQWLPLLQKRVVLEVDMNDWQMVLEQWADGTTSMPKFGKSGGKKLPVEIRASWVYARNGQLTYEDHGTPWSVVAPGMDIHIIWAEMYKKYVGTATFSNGAVQILNFLPMRTDFAARVSIETGKPVQIENINLMTDGAVSKVKGVVEFGDRWPEQRYDVESRVNFPRMRELFFANDAWRMAGEGLFKGQFHLFKGGRELKGDFTSANAVLTASERDYPFPDLRGSLFWSRDRFDVTPATAGFFGGTTSFTYGLLLNHPGGAPATFRADYDHVDVAALSRLFRWKEVKIDGVARGHHAMAWTNGHFGATITGDGEMVVTPPAGTDLASSILPSPLRIPERRLEKIEISQRAGVLAIGGDATYHLDPNGLDFGESWAATPSSYAAFHGRFDFDGGRLNMPVHVASRDAQESDRLLAAILTERGSKTNVIAVGGAFTFDGLLTETFSSLRAAGHFAGESIFAFANTWRTTTGDIVLQNNFVDVAHGLVTGTEPGSRMDINGRFALGVRNEPTIEEMRATIHVEQWPLADFKRSFGLEDWPVFGTGTADLKLHGPYKRLLGDGTLQIVNGVAWKEPFEKATGTLEFIGTGLKINPLEITKGPGAVHGTTSINWTDNTYTFDVDGVGIHVDTLSNFSSDKAKLSGVLGFHAKGESSFASPAYAFKGSIPDLFVADQGIGAVAGTLTVRNKVVTIDQLEVAGLGQASGHGTIAFDDRYTSDLSLTIVGASIDPYLKFFTDASWFQYTRLSAGGSVRVRGPLAEPAALDVVANIDDARLKLFDYELHNGGPFVLNYQRKSLWIGQPTCTDVRLPACHLELLGPDGTETQLQISGNVSGTESTIDLLAQGSASLAILRAFKGFGDVVAAGTATIEARLAGDSGDPHFSGKADIKDGQLKFPWLPRTIEGLNGPITINPTGVNFDGLRGQMGEGDVEFGGTIGFKDYRPEEFNLTLTGTGVTLRDYPKGFDSTVNARLWLRGPFETPLLGGDVDVMKVRLQAQIEPDVSLIALAAGGGGGSAPPADVGAPIDSTVVVRSDVHIHVPPMRLIDTRNLWITGGTDDLVIRGTFDKPVISGRIDVLDGKFFFSGNQFKIQPGSIEFSNPAKFDPYFNLRAEAQARGGGQSYRIDLRVTGSLDGKPSVVVSSEPWLSQNDIYAVLLGGAPNFNTSDIRNLRDPQQYEVQLMATLTAQLLIAQSGVSGIFEKTLPFDTVQFTPTLLSGDVSLQSLNPNARVTIGKRISEKVYLIYSRDLNTSSPAINEFYLLQFDQNDRLQWILSRNEDQSFALDFRFRHIF